MWKRYRPVTSLENLDLYLMRDALALEPHVSCVALEAQTQSHPSNFVIFLDVHLKSHPFQLVCSHQFNHQILA